MKWSIKFNTNENETLDNNEMNVEFSRDGWTIDWPILNVVTFYQNRSKLFHSIHGENGLTAAWCRFGKFHTIWYSLCRWWRQAHKSRNFTTFAIIYWKRLKIVEPNWIRKIVLICSDSYKSTLLNWSKQVHSSGRTHFVLEVLSKTKPSGHAHPGTHFWDSNLSVRIKF